MNMDQTTFYEELQKFPPKLRKLALFIAESKEFMSLSKYSKAAGMSPNSTISMICKARRNGNDFNGLLTKICNDKLGAYRPQMMKVLVREGLKGSYRHAELYFRLLGELKETPKTEHNIHNSLTFVLPMPSELPQKLGIPRPEPVDITPDPEE
jgi:hypothetical protein